MSALPLAFLTPWASIAIYIAVAAIWLVPDGRIEWDVGHGNERAARFYRALGAAPATGFDRYRWTR